MCLNLTMLCPAHIMCYTLFDDKIEYAMFNATETRRMKKSALQPQKATFFRDCHLSAAVLSYLPSLRVSENTI